MTETPEIKAPEFPKEIKGKVSITDDAQVMYQADATNPLPGVVVGALVKGDHVLDLSFAPAIGVTFDGALLETHINMILAPLTALAEVGDAPQPVQEIAVGLREGLGIVSRETFQAQIAMLDDGMRSILRSKGVRFGPLTVFCYDLNKPAAVRLRGLLYALFHGMDLPAPVPADGMVSKAVDLSADDPLRGFYTAIGYPVYGPRCIRIDMLDRVVNLVYESADKGKFKAQHSMAEWLGCGIADLYAVLEGLGHTKIYDPADVVKDEIVEVTETPAVDEKPAEVGAVKKPDVKPELATFVLKKGKAAAGKKMISKKPKPKREKPKSKGKPKREPRVMSAEAAPVATEDSPWAALASLKK